MKDITGFRYKRLVALEPTNERKNGCVVWKCKCDCGNICYVKSSDLTCSRKGSCGCLEKENQQTIGQRIDNKKDLTGQKFGRLTALYPTELRSGTSVIWHCKCDCGNEKDISASALGKTIFSCGCLSKEVHSDIAKKLFSSNLIGQRFGKLVVLEQVEQQDKNGTYWKCQCDCGNIKIIKGHSLTSGNTLSCGCLRESHGEYFIRQLLINNDISFIQEFCFDSCIFEDTLRQARFDFCILDKNNKCKYLIEYDGEQHFKFTGNGWNTEEKLKITQKHDQFKNQWCKEHNIPLIRIPYTHLKDLCLEDLLLETSQFILK
jgi:hypothetical protein